MARIPIRLSRRQLLLGGGAAAALGLTGCLSAALTDTVQSPAAPVPMPPATSAGGSAPSLDLAAPPARSQPAAAPSAAIARPVRQVASRLGAVLPLSGPGAFEGVAFRHGAELALDEVNARGLLRPLGIESLTLEFADGAGDARATAEATRALVAGGAALLLASGDEAAPGRAADLARDPAAWTAPAALALAETAASAGLPVLFGHANADTLAASGAAVFRLGAPARTAAGATLSYLAGLAKAGRGAAGRLAILHNEQPLTAALAELIALGAAEAGFEVVARLQHPMGQANLTPVARRARDEGAQVLVTCHYWSDGRVLAENVAAAGLDFSAVVGCLSGAFTQPRLVRQIGARADNLFDVNWALPRTVAWTRLNAALAERWPGEAFGYHQWLGWASVQLAADASRRAGTLDGDAVTAALAASDLRLEAAPWAGPVRFDAAGRSLAAVPPLVQIQDGQARVVAPGDLAEAAPRFPARPGGPRRA